MHTQSQVKLQKYWPMINKKFLSATWEYLAMFNYEVDPGILIHHLPPGTELDYYEGKTFVSVVGFLFNNTKVLGVRWPFHTNFEEVNLRYYIKRNENGIWKRGVGFISEIVPKPIVARLANFLYNEHYSSAKMNHRVIKTADTILVEYQLQIKKSKNLMRLNAFPNSKKIEEGTEAEFILEHYFGYNQLNDCTTIEYAVNHPRWEVFDVKDYYLDFDIEKLYGKKFKPFIQGVKPHSVFLAKGSGVTVSKPLKIKIQKNNS